MNRFRAWDKVGKCFAYEGFNVIGEVTALGGMENYIHERNKRTGDKRGTIECWGDFILMQSTGLADQNGKEIFEGDVIRQDYSYSDGLKYEDWLVEWEPAGAGFSPFCCLGSDVGSPLSLTAKAKKESFSNYASPNECVIIGNICENPHLLMEQK